jgi:hypothetical protein
MIGNELVNQIAASNQTYEVVALRESDCTDFSVNSVTANVIEVV